MVFSSRVILIKISRHYYPTESIKTSHNSSLRRFKYLESFLGTLLHWASDLESVYNVGMCSRVWGPALF